MTKEMSNVKNLQNHVSIHEPINYDSVWPWPRSGHQMVSDDNYSLYLYGGYNPFFMACTNPKYPLFPELWKYNTITREWSFLKTEGSAPEHCASHSMFYYDCKLWVIGGTGFPFGYGLNSELYCCDLKTLNWKIVKSTGKRPLPSYGSALALDKNNLWFVLGTSGYIYHNNIYCLNLKTFNWKEYTNEFNSPQTRNVIYNFSFSFSSL